MNKHDSQVIAVFGGSRPPENSSEYVEAYTIGKLLAQHGFTVMNGGYGGTMEASARGAHENGGRTVGVLSSEFAWLSPNRFLHHVEPSQDLFSRIRYMQTHAHAFVVLKGSMGTLAELALVWNLAKIDTTQRKPIILVGAAWAQVLGVMRQQLPVTDEEAALLQFAQTPEATVQLLIKCFE